MIIKHILHFAAPRFCLVMLLAPCFSTRCCTSYCNHMHSCMLCWQCTGAPNLTFSNHLKEMQAFTWLQPASILNQFSIPNPNAVSVNRVYLNMVFLLGFLHTSNAGNHVQCIHLPLPMESATHEAVALMEPWPRLNLAEASVSAMQNGEQLRYMGRVI